MPRRVNHYRNILNEQPTSIRMVETGAMIRFRYRRPNITDRNPLCLYLWRDRKLKLIHSINLNYLYETKVEKLYKLIRNPQSRSIYSFSFGEFVTAKLAKKKL